MLPDVSPTCRPHGCSVLLGPHAQVPARLFLLVIRSSAWSWLRTCLAASSAGEGLGPNLRVRVDCPLEAEGHASARNTGSGLKAQRERWGLQGCSRGRTGEPERVWSSPSQPHWGPFEVHLSSQSLRFSCFPGTMASVLPPIMRLESYAVLDGTRVGEAQPPPGGLNLFHRCPLSLP